MCNPRRREALLGLLHERLDLRGLDRVGAGRQVNDHVAERLAVQAAEAGIALRAQLHAADIANAKQGSVRQRAHNDVAELRGIDQAAGSVHRLLKIRSVGAGACPGAPAGFCRFCALMALLTSVAVMPEFRHLVGSTQTRIEYTSCEESRVSPTP